RFRRYQQLLEVEVWIEDNPAVGHTATYARRGAERSGSLEAADVVNVMVTRYRTDAGVARGVIELAQGLARDGSYRVEEIEVAGVRAVRLAARDERWLLWPARGHVIKLGRAGGDPGAAIPDELVEAYGDRYPSVLAA